MGDHPPMTIPTEREWVRAQVDEVIEAINNQGEYTLTARVPPKHWEEMVGYHDRLTDWILAQRQESQSDG